MKPEIVYYYRGMIETRGRWIMGYSENSSDGRPLYPWQAKRACQSEAKNRGCKAVFVEKIY